MARPKFARRNDPPRHKIKWEFKYKENRIDLASKKKYTKEAISNRRIPIDPNVPAWARGFVNVMHAFRENH